MSTTPASTFNGTSTYAGELQNVITHAVALKTLPMTLLQNQESTLTGQQSEIQTLGTLFQSLQTSLDSVNSATGIGSYSATSSTPAVATATLSSGATAGTYSIAVSSIGSQTNTISANGLTTVDDPTVGNISANSPFSLTVDGTAYQIPDASGSLDGLASAINSSGAAVQATVVNVGGSASPDYRLSIQGTEYAATAIQLSDSTSTSLLNTLATGSNVTYQVNGEPAIPVSSTSQTLDVSPGVAVNVLAVGAASVTVAQSGAGIANALSSFATSYNAASAELLKNRGQNGGALAGQNVVEELSSAMQTLTGYSPTTSGSVASLADLGLSFSSTGTLTFDQTAFDATTASSLSGALNFLGSETGGGFLQAADGVLTGITDPVSGVITQQTNALGSSIDSLTAEIGTDQAGITTLQNTLTHQMSTADAAIAALQTQVTEITDLFSSMQTESKANSG
jgi:flagellar hook-associated protein 2